MKMRTVLLLSAFLTSVSFASLAPAEGTPVIQPAPGESGEPVPPRNVGPSETDKDLTTTPVQQKSIVEEKRPATEPPLQQAPQNGQTASRPIPPAPVPPPQTPFNMRAVDEISKINAATEVVQEIVAAPEGISPSLLSNAYGIVIIPGTIKLGFIFGGQYGSGIAMIRNDDGTWSNPSFVYIGGGSFGLQIGAVSSDIILVFKTRKSVMGMAKGNFTLGGDAAVAAGPVGRRAVALTDWQLKAEIYSYARSRGFFAGISLDGSVLAIDVSANEDFYGKLDISASDIFASPPSASPAVSRLKNLLAKSASAP